MYIQMEHKFIMSETHQVTEHYGYGRRHLRQSWSCRFTCITEEKPIGPMSSNLCLHSTYISNPECWKITCRYTLT